MKVKSGRHEFDLTVQDQILYNGACYQIIIRKIDSGFDALTPRIALAVENTSTIELLKENTPQR